MTRFIIVSPLLILFPSSWKNAVKSAKLTTKSLLMTCVVWDETCSSVSGLTKNILLYCLTTKLYLLYMTNYLLTCQPSFVQCRVQAKQDHKIICPSPCTNSAQWQVNSCNVVCCVCACVHFMPPTGDRTLNWQIHTQIHTWTQLFSCWV